ncbi:MAG: alpha/beta hydrolase, partial [Elioraea sp.]|nr:alpha/beta hydrolase [Elioraea sp.]
MRRAVLFVLGALVLALGAVAVWAWQPDLDRADLEARYSRGPEDFVGLAGVRLHLRDEGPHDGPPVILLHGFGASLHTWD